MIRPPAPALDLSEEDRREVLKILQAQIPKLPVWAFGSRVQGTARAYSDLDLAVITQEPLSMAAMADLKNAFDESDLVFKVDLVDWATTSENFRKIIKKTKVVLQDGAHFPQRLA
jgi:predicted nucleotidyltransferase